MVKVYKYGLRRPVQEEDVSLVRAQMRAGHTYKNKLVEIECERRNRIRAAVSNSGTVAALEADVAAAKICVEECKIAIAKHRAATKGLKVPPPLYASIKDARDRLKLARVQLFRERTAAKTDEAATGAVQKANEWAVTEAKAARAACGVYWGTYLLAEAAVYTARQTPLYDGSEPKNPHFSRWDGNGRIGVHIVHGLTVADVFGNNTQLRIDPVPEETFVTPHRGVRRKLSRTKLHIRVGSGAKRKPIWVTFPLELHRPLPPEGVIKDATVSLHKVGPYERWHLTISVDLPDTWRSGNCGKGAVAVDLGWRLLGEDIRVGTWVDEASNRGEVRWNPAGMQKANELTSTRSKSLNEMNAKLVPWLRGRKLPAALLAATEHCASWRSPARWAALASLWAANRFIGDQEGFDLLGSWRYHDWHLWRWEAFQRRGELNRRRNYYREVASKLAQQYDTLVLENFNMRAMAKKQAIEDISEEGPKHDNPNARAQRVIVSPGELRLALVQAFQSRGGRVVYMSSVNTTRTCHACGHTEAFDTAATVMHTCTKCAALWDQDDNASKNLLQRWREHPESARPAVAAKKDKRSKWARAKESAANKRANHEQPNEL